MRGVHFTLIITSQAEHNFAAIMKSYSDHSLFELVKKDNHLAYTFLIDRYWENLYRHIYQKIRNEEDAKDIVQDIFLSLWKNRSEINSEEKTSLAPYLFTAAKYAVINRFSRSNIIIADEEMLEKSLNMVSSTKTDEQLLTKELRGIVDHEVNQLPDRLQMPYRMSREEQLSIREIALKLSLSEQTVKNNISTALHIVRTRVGKYNAEPSFQLILAITAFLHHK